MSPHSSRFWDRNYGSSVRVILVASLAVLAACGGSNDAADTTIVGGQNTVIETTAETSDTVPPPTEDPPKSGEVDLVVGRAIVAEYYEVSDAELDQVVDNLTGFDDYEDYLTDLICNPYAIEATTAEGMRIHAEIRELSCPWVIPQRAEFQAADDTTQESTSLETVDDAIGISDGPGIVTIRPVLECWSTGDPPPSDAGAQPLPYPARDVVCSLGPTAGTSELFARGSAEVIDQQGWAVIVELRAEGKATWNDLAAQCYNVAPTCPSPEAGQRGQIAIVLNDVIVNAPAVNQTNFESEILITGDFTEAEATALAEALNNDAHPETDE